MNPYEEKSFFKKKVSYERKKNSEKIFKFNLQLTHQIFNTINISLLFLISTLFFLSLDSQRKWSNTYKVLSKTKAINNNLIDYISRYFTANSFKRFWSNFGDHSFSFYLCISSFKFGRNASIICSGNRIRNYKNCFREFVLFSDYAFFMEWIDLLEFVLIEDIKNLIFYLRIKPKDVYLINNTSFIPNK